MGLIEAWRSYDNLETLLRTVVRTSVRLGRDEKLYRVFVRAILKASIIDVSLCRGGVKRWWQVMGGRGAWHRRTASASTWSHGAFHWQFHKSGQGLAL